MASRLESFDIKKAAKQLLKQPGLRNPGARDYYPDLDLTRPDFSVTFESLDTFSLGLARLSLHVIPPSEKAGKQISREIFHFDIRTREDGTMLGLKDDTFVMKFYPDFQTRPIEEYTKDTPFYEITYTVEPQEPNVIHATKVTRAGESFTDDDDRTEVLETLHLPEYANWRLTIQRFFDTNPDGSQITAQQIAESPLVPARIGK